jgi:hypothetical protein
MTDDLSHEAYVDLTIRDAILQMAVDEGMLNELPRGDYYLRSRFRSGVPSWLKEQALEQLVLTPRIVAFDPGYGTIDNFEGSLIDEGVVGQVTRSTEPIIGSHPIPREVLLGMLAARGQPLTEQQVVARVDALKIAVAEQEGFETRTGKTPPTSWGRVVVQGLRKAGIDVPSEYTDAEYEEQARRDQIYSEVQLVVDCITEYHRIVDASSTSRALIRAPLMAATGGFVPAKLGGPNEAGGDSLVLLRVVAAELGRLTFRPTLRETLRLARDPATKALRDRIAAWLTAISTGHLDDLAPIRKEVAKAALALERANSAGQVSNVATWISLPATIADALLNLPGVLSGAATGAGVTALTTQAVLRRTYRWAMFGSLPTIPHDRVR